MAASDESKVTVTRVGADEARQQLGEIIDRAWDGERFVITRHERERVVLLGYRDYERLVGERDSIAVTPVAG